MAGRAEEAKELDERLVLVEHVRLVGVVAVRARAGPRVRGRRALGAGRLLVVAARARHGRLPLQRVRARRAPRRVQRLAARVVRPLGAAQRGGALPRLPAVRRRPHGLAAHAHVPSRPSERVQHSFLDLFDIFLLHEPDLFGASCEVTRPFAHGVFVLRFKFTSLKIILSIYIIVDLVYFSRASGVGRSDVAEGSAVRGELIGDLGTEAGRAYRDVDR